MSGASGSAAWPLDRARCTRDLAWCALIQLVAMLAGGVLALRLDPPFAPLSFAALILVSHGTMLLGALLVLRAQDQWLGDVGAERPARGWLRPFLWLVPTQLALWLLLLPLAIVLSKLDQRPQAPAIESVGPLRVPALLATALLVGFVEELLFRGLILDRLTRLFGGAQQRGAFAGAAVVSSLWFGAAHVFLGVGALCMTTAIGLFLAYVVRRAGGNLVLAISVHALQDTFGLLIAPALSSALCWPP